MFIKTLKSFFKILQTIFYKYLYFFKIYDIIMLEVDDMQTKILLVVDDSSVITNFVDKIFNSEFKVIIAKDGIEAIEAVRNNFDQEFVGMLLDLNMPRFNGFEVLETFNKNNLFNKIPVCILTGDDTKDSLDKVFKYPIVDVLNKPFSENDIKTSISKLALRGKQ